MKPPNPKFNGWIGDWLTISEHWSSPRYTLATQLRYIRQSDGNKEARLFSNWLTYLGVYPIRKENYLA
jgi:hypothetical protein